MILCVNPPGICDIEQLGEDICKTPSSSQNSRARPNYCHWTSLINMLQRPEIRGGLSTPGRILCEINQQFVKPNYFGLEKWRGHFGPFSPPCWDSAEWGRRAGRLGMLHSHWARISRMGQSSCSLEPAAPFFQANLGICIPVTDYFI